MLGSLQAGSLCIPLWPELEDTAGIGDSFLMFNLPTFFFLSEIFTLVLVMWKCYLVTNRLMLLFVKLKSLLLNTSGSLDSKRVDPAVCRALVSSIDRLASLHGRLAESWLILPLIYCSSLTAFHFLALMSECSAISLRIPQLLLPDSSPPGLPPAPVQAVPRAFSE